MSNTGCELNLTSKCVGVFNELQKNADTYSIMMLDILKYIIKSSNTFKDPELCVDAIGYMQNLQELSDLFSLLVTDEEDEL